MVTEQTAEKQNFVVHKVGTCNVLYTYFNFPYFTMIFFILKSALKQSLFKSENQCIIFINSIPDQVVY